MEESLLRCGTASEYCYWQLRARANKFSWQQQLHLFPLTMQNLSSCKHSGEDHQQGMARGGVSHHLTLPCRSIRSTKMFYMTLQH